MFRKFLILPLTALSLAAFAISGPAAAQKPGEPTAKAATINASKSNNFKVTAVDAKARTFSGAATDGKQLTFKLARGTLPQVGKLYDVTYTGNPGGGPLQATNLNSSRSN